MANVIRPPEVEDRTEQLFDYQKFGSAWLAPRRRAILADEMGIGKTCQAIQASDNHPLPILVLCMAVGRHNWRNEFYMFSRRPGNPTIGLILCGDDIPIASKCDIVICSYDLAIGEKNELGSSKPNCTIRPELLRNWSVLILDEFHVLKNRNANRTSAVLESLAPNCGYVWPLSGTPAPNYPNELWPIMRAFNITPLAYWDFVRRYCKTRDTQWRTEITGGQRIDELRNILAPFVLRRRKEEVLKDLPPLRFSDVILPPGEVPIHKWELYFQRYVINAARFQGDMEMQERLLAAALDHKQILNEDGDIEILSVLPDRVRELRRWIGLQKVYSLIELLTYELENNAYDKIILFAFHGDIIKELEEGLKKFRPVVVKGDTAPARRQNAVDKFTTDKKCRIFIGNILAAGTTINLTVASEVGMVESDWVPGNNAQAIMRAHRIGQLKPVNVRFFALANSIDQKIQAVYRRKARTLTQLFDTPIVVDPFEE